MPDPTVQNAVPMEPHQSCSYRDYIQEQIQQLDEKLEVAGRELKSQWGTSHQFEPEHAVRSMTNKKHMVEAVLAACVQCNQETTQQETCPAAQELIRLAIST